MRELNLDGLNEEFGIDGNLPVNTDLDFEEIEIDYSDAVSILKGNIQKANQLLDRIQNEMLGGNSTARMFEVAGNLINAITTASKEIISKENYEKYIGIKEELNKLKEREVIIKEKSGVKGGNVQNQQNIIVTSREDLLKIMDGKKPQKQIEQPMKQITNERN
jgi:hypothetical protein